MYYQEEEWLFYNIMRLGMCIDIVSCKLNYIITMIFCTLEPIQYNLCVLINLHLCGILIQERKICHHGNSIIQTKTAETLTLYRRVVLGGF